MILLTLTTGLVPNYRVLSISPTFILVGFQILMCGCILGWWSVAYHFGVAVTLTLTIDLTPTLFVGGLKKIGMRMHLGMAMCRVQYWGHCDLLDLGLNSSF